MYKIAAVSVGVCVFAVCGGDLTVHDPADVMPLPTVPMMSSEIPSPDLSPSPSSSASSMTSAPTAEEETTPTPSATPVFALDPECRNGVDYVIRPAESIGDVTVRLSHVNALQDVPIMAFQVAACRTLSMEGMFFWFLGLDRLMDMEDTDPLDGSGMIIGLTETGSWRTRLYGFTVWRDGETIFGPIDMHRYTIDDSAGSAQLYGPPFVHFRAGEAIRFVFSASVRSENPPAESYGFVTGLGDLGGLVFSEFSEPTPAGHVIARGADYTPVVYVWIMP